MALTKTILAGDIKSLLINGDNYHVPNESGCSITTTVGTTKVSANEIIPTNEGKVVKIKTGYAGIKELTIHTNTNEFEVLSNLNHTGASFDVQLTLVDGTVYYGTDMSFSDGIELKTEDMSVAITIYGDYFYKV